MLQKNKKSLIGNGNKSLIGKGNNGGEESFSTPSKRSYFGRRNLKDQPHHERILNEGIKKVESLQGYCSDFSSSINNWYEKFCAFQEANEDLSQCFSSVYRGTKEKMERVVTTYSKEVDSTKNRKLPKLWDQIEKFSAELAKYSSDIQVKKEWLEARNKTLCSYNHYTTKCAGLKAKQDKCKEAGKEETSKQKQKLKRNQEKLGQAKAAFYKEHEAILESLHHCWDSRFTFLDGLVAKVICNELMFFESYVKSLRSTKNVLEKTMKQLPNPPDHSPGQAEEGETWDFSANGPPVIENSQFDNPSGENSLTSSKKQESGRGPSQSEEQEFFPMRKSEGEIFPLEDTPTKSKRTKRNSRTPQSAPVNAPSNPFASPPSAGQDPFVFPVGEQHQSETSSKRDVDFQFITLEQETACGERVGSENQTSSFTNEQNPFKIGSAKKNGSPDPFESFFENN